MTKDTNRKYFDVFFDIFNERLPRVSEVFVANILRGCFKAFMFNYCPSEVLKCKVFEMPNFFISPTNEIAEFFDQ